jgi:hypothetical protein
MSSENQTIIITNYQESYNIQPKLSRSYKAYCSKCRDSCYIDTNNKEGTCSTCSTCNNS